MTEMYSHQANETKLSMTRYSRLNHYVSTASLTRWRAHASIDFCLSHWNGIRRNSTTKASLVRPLNALHRRWGARLVNFGGWDMPVEYPSSGGLIAEHKTVRSSGGVFDVSHMGDIRIRGGGKPGGALQRSAHQP